MDQMAFSEEDRGRFDDLLASAKPFLLEQERQDDLRPPNFNIFRVLGYEYRETSTHSALLAHLLNPFGSHGQKEVFLRIFLEILEKAASDQNKPLSVSLQTSSDNWACEPEFVLRSPYRGKIDIVLRHREHLIIIENKIHAADQSNQLYRYWEYANATFKGNKLKSFLILYLTPLGVDPSSYSLSPWNKTFDNWPEPRRELINFSYRKHIKSFLERSIQSLESERRAISISELLRQYENLVRSIK